MTQNAELVVVGFKDKERGGRGMRHSLATLDDMCLSDCTNRFTHKNNRVSNTAVKIKHIVTIIYLI